MKFTKMHGTGNDFVVMQAQGGEHDWERLAVAMCHRHFGVGADGLILALPSDRADVRMRMFNPDGSEAEMCGNGIRCLARYVVERRLASPVDGAITVETLPGVLRCELSGDGGAVDRVRVSMGVPVLEPARIPVAVEGPAPVKDLPVSVDGGTYPVTCVSMGNPHAVHFTDAPVADFPLETQGPKVEHHAAFPRRVNFEVARIQDRAHLEARIWERGAGATLACGTGVCATVVAARLHGLVDDRAEVRVPGGTLLVEWDGRGEVYLTGPAVAVFEGDWLLDA